jgi:hypothetical protein
MSASVICNGLRRADWTGPPAICEPVALLHARNSEILMHRFRVGRMYMLSGLNNPSIPVFYQ